MPEPDLEAHDHKPECKSGMYVEPPTRQEPDMEWCWRCERLVDAKDVSKSTGKCMWC